jgi:integrase
MAGRRRFGRLRKLPSGRWQARYSTPDGREHAAPDTFSTKTAAERWLAGVETDMARGQWIDPSSQQLLLRAYAESWLAARPDFKIRTRELYQWLLNKYVLPQLGDLPLDKITPTVVRGWHAALLRDGSPTPARQSYALLRGILNTAVADELIMRNPCLVRGAGVARTGERSVATLPQIQALADAVPPRYRMLILLAAWSGARWGELVALSCARLDLDRGTMTIDRQYVELEDNSLVLDTPKTAAGIRTVHLPPHLLDELRERLDAYPDPDRGRSLVFTNGEGRPLSRGGFRSTWVKARERVGLPTFRFHDLRHTGNTLAASTGASTKELMARMGHASMRAALIYQHASADRDAAIAAALSRLAVGETVVGTTGHGRPPLRDEGRARPRPAGT